MIFTGDPASYQSQQEGDLLGDIERIQVLIISSGVGHHVLPRDDDQNIQIEPPHHQQREIEVPYTVGILVPRYVRTQAKSCHQRHKVQEKDDISGEEIRDVAAHYYFVVSPKELVQQPERNSQCDQRPEQPNASFAAQHQGDEGSRA